MMHDDDDDDDAYGLDKLIVSYFRTASSTIFINALCI